MVEQLSKLVLDLYKYVEVRYRLAKIDATEKIVLMFSFFITLIIIVLMAAAVMTFLSFSLAYYLGSLLSSRYLGFLIVSGIYLFIGAIVVIFKQKLITNPVLKMMFSKWSAGNKKNGNHG